MRAVKVTDRGVDVVEVDRPAGDGVEVRIEAAGICGTDLNVMGRGASPITLGHGSPVCSPTARRWRSSR